MVTKVKKKVVPEPDMSFDLSPAPKKKKPSTEVVVAPLKKKKTPLLDLDAELKAKPKRISKLKVADNLVSILGDDAESLQQLLETGDSDSALTLLNKRLIQTSVDLIAEVESGIRESKGRYGVHSFNGLVQSIRELMLDLQATKDRGALGLTLVENVLRPAFLDMAMAVMQEYATVANGIKDQLEPKIYDDFRKQQLESRDRIGAMLQSQYMKIKDESVQFLQR
jgi:hypothetical protein